MVYEVGCSVRRRSKADETTSSCRFLCQAVPCATLSMGEGRSAVSGCPFCPSADIQAQSTIFIFLLYFLAAAPPGASFAWLVQHGPKGVQRGGAISCHSLPPEQQASEHSSYTVKFHWHRPLGSTMSLASITHTPPQHQHWVVGITQRSPLASRCVARRTSPAPCQHHVARQ